MERKFTRGFTLLELLIAIFIVSVVLTTIYAAYTGTFRITRNADYTDNIYGMARVTIKRIMEDLESVSPYRGILELVCQKSEPEQPDSFSFSFSSAGSLDMSGSGRSSGNCRIRYFLEKNENEGLRLIRSERLDTGVERLRAVDGFALCNRLQGLTFRFYDQAGTEFESWDSKARDEKSKAPSAVSVQLDFINPDNKEKPYRFLTRVFLPLSAKGETAR